MQWGDIVISRAVFGALLAVCAVGTGAATFAQPNPFGDPEILETECGEGNLESCSKLANHLVTRNSEESKARSVEIHAATCEKGHLPACGDLAAAYSLGLGVEQDEQRAYEIDRELCEEKDYGPACGSLGFTYALGKAGFEKDEGRALEYFVRACDLEYAGGCERAGQHWNSLLNPERDIAKAIGYHKRGCDLGDSYACDGMRRLEAE